MILEKVSSFLFLFTFGLSAITITPKDTITVFLAGGIIATYQKPSGFKASESAIGRLSFQHLFNDNIGVKISFKGARAFPTPFIEDGFINWHRNGFSISGGLLNSRYGTCKLYKPFSVFNPLFDRFILWDSYGFGFFLEKAHNRIRFNGAVTLNNHENGALHLLVNLNFKHFNSILLAGFQSYSIKNQDNSIIAGTDILSNWKYIDLHAVFKYAYYTGYGSSLNKTMKPGILVESLFEIRAYPLSSLSISIMTYCEYLKKRFEHLSILGGSDIEWMFIEWLGVAAGFEFLTHDNIFSKITEFAIVIKPIKDHALLRISFKKNITDNSSSCYILGGNVCIDF